MQKRAPSGRVMPDSKRRVFTKQMKDRNALVTSIHHGKRFIEGMETFKSKAELLAKLQDTREMGMKRDVLSLINSVEHVETLFIPLLGHVMNEETQRPVYRTLRQSFDGYLRCAWLDGHSYGIQSCS